MSTQSTMFSTRRAAPADLINIAAPADATCPVALSDYQAAYLRNEIATSHLHDTVYFPHGCRDITLRGRDMVFAKLFAPNDKLHTAQDSRFTTSDHALALLVHAAFHSVIYNNYRDMFSWHKIMTKDLNQANSAREDARRHKDYLNSINDTAHMLGITISTSDLSVITTSMTAARREGVTDWLYEGMARITNSTNTEQNVQPRNPEPVVHRFIEN